MEQNFFLFFRVLAAAVFLGSLFVGYYLLKNYQRFFGVDPSMPSENSSARAYSKLQIFAVLGHVLFASAAFALLLH